MFNTNDELLNLLYKKVSNLIINSSANIARISLKLFGLMFQNMHSEIEALDWIKKSKIYLENSIISMKEKTNNSIVQAMVIDMLHTYDIYGLNCPLDTFYEIIEKIYSLSYFDDIKLQISCFKFFSQIEILNPRELDYFINLIKNITYFGMENIGKMDENDQNSMQEVMFQLMVSQFGKEYYEFYKNKFFDDFIYYKHFKMMNSIIIEKSIKDVHFKFE